MVVVARGPEDAGQQEVCWEPQRLSEKLLKLECLLMSFFPKILSQSDNHWYHMGEFKILCNDIIVGVWEVTVWLVDIKHRCFSISQDYLKDQGTVMPC